MKFMAEPSYRLIVTKCFNPAQVPERPISPNLGLKPHCSAMSPHNPDTFELIPRDLRPYREGNTCVDYVHRFESGRPGPHVLVNALTHGNEFCGMVAATH